MRYAVHLPNFGDFANVRAIADVARAAETEGWDGCFIWDHVSPVFVPGMLVPTADVTVALTAIALATTDIRFGALVTPLPRRRPQKVARELASLDHLSNGRVVLGVGLGVPAETEYEAFGEESRVRYRAKALDESLHVVTELWLGEPVDYDGDLLHVHTVPLLPSPVQQPRIPIWVAATWPGSVRPFKRAARWDGVIPIRPNPDEAFITADDVAEVRRTVGRREPAYDIVVNGGPNADPLEFESAGATWWLEVAFTREDALARVAKGPPC